MIRVTAQAQEAVGSELLALPYRIDREDARKSGHFYNDSRDRKKRALPVTSILQQQRTTCSQRLFLFAQWMIEKVRE